MDLYQHKKFPENYCDKNVIVRTINIYVIFSIVEIVYSDIAFSN